MCFRVFVFTVLKSVFIILIFHVDSESREGLFVGCNVLLQLFLIAKVGHSYIPSTVLFQRGKLSNSQFPLLGAYSEPVDDTDEVVEASDSARLRN